MKAIFNITISFTLTIVAFFILQKISITTGVSWQVNLVLSSFFTILISVIREIIIFMTKNKSEELDVIYLNIFGISFAMLVIYLCV